MVNLDGFDTHENQNVTHSKLMMDLSSAISEFYNDLKVSNQDHDVLSLTFSEFGRRVKENNGGTDHGTAAPILLFGPALDGNGNLGDDLDLKNLDNSGNLKSSIDFRSVYATILQSWLCLDPSTVDDLLGDYYNRIPNLGFGCLPVATNDYKLLDVIHHNIKQDGFGGFVIEFNTNRPGTVRVEIYTIMGQKLTTLLNTHLNSGNHQVLYDNLSTIHPSLCVYQISSGNISVSGKFISN